MIKQIERFIRRRISNYTCLGCKGQAFSWLLLLSSALSLTNTAAQEIFSETAEKTGLDFVHFNGMSGEFYFVEHMGGGVALIDYDNDGDLDIYLTQGHMLGAGKSLKDALFPPPPEQQLTDRLFRNDLVVDNDGGRSLDFTDVTEAARIDASGYGMGVAAGDYDNDGFVDLYVNNFGRNQLLRNNGDGTFSDMTEKAAVGDPGLSISSAFVDFNRDGLLDLYVANYVHYAVENNKPCYGMNGVLDYCQPNFYEAARDRLYRNRGDGRFEDVSEKARITRAKAPSLGVIGADFNGDNWADIYVANDMKPNHLWINQKDGTFKEEGFLAGVAVNMEGAPEASMGVDAADFDGDGDEDLFMTHLWGETNTIYVNNGDGWFEDRTLATGLGAPSKTYTSFGTVWIDYDNDGWLDLFIANGDVKTMPILARSGDKYPMRQPNQLFANLGNGQFKEVTNQAGEVFKLTEVSRGLASGDVDNDGDSDIVLANNAGRARLMINTLGNRNHWLGLRLINASGQDALGARVVVYSENGKPIWRRVRTDGSYASANDPRILVGLGRSTKLGPVRVYWASGRIEEWQELRIDRYTTLREGQGRALKARK